MVKRLTDGIDVDQLNQEIRDLGVRVRVFKSTLCPGGIKSLESLDHDINCTACNKNMIDFDCQESIGMVQQQDLVEKFKIQGTFNMDEILMTFTSDISVFMFARIEVLDFREPFFELVQKQTTPLSGFGVDRLKYPACDIDAVFVVQNSVRTEYHLGPDFNIDINGDVQWTGTHRPADGTVYSIYYRYHPVYRAVRALHRDRYTQFNSRPAQIQSNPKKTVDGRTYVKLPETWILKRDYLLERRDIQQALLPDNPYPDPNA